MKITLSALFICPLAFAFDASKCSTMLNNGLYKKYKWAGVGEANGRAITNETKSAGTTKATSRMSTEGSTVILDPKYSTNVSLSGTQSFSSWGQCSPLAMMERREQRDLYVTQNFDQIKKDIAMGSGEHLKTLAWYALCDDDATDGYSQTLQTHFEILSKASQTTFSHELDRVVESSPALKSRCMSLSSL